MINLPPLPDDGEVFNFRGTEIKFTDGGWCEFVEGVFGMPSFWEYCAISEQCEITREYIEWRLRTHD